jgi:hypothetical protein
LADRLLNCKRNIAVFEARNRCGGEFFLIRYLPLILMLIWGPLGYGLIINRALRRWQNAWA